MHINKGDTKIFEELFIENQLTDKPCLLKMLKFNKIKKM